VCSNRETLGQHRKGRIRRKRLRYFLELIDSIMLRMLRSSSLYSLPFLEQV
jgi:hypothetical protein